MGRTSGSPLVLEYSEAGTRSFVLRKEGFESDTVEVYIGLDEVTEVDVVLRPPGMGYIRGGSFSMGSDDGPDNERPQHEVVLDPFYIDRTEVTVDAYRRFDPAYDPSLSGDRLPATNVTWDEANRYCASLGKRLPTEAEWERACRGPKGRLYAYGDAYDASLAWTGKRMTEGPVEATTRQIETAGIYGLTGNVWEWCADWYDRDYYQESSAKDPKGPRFGVQRVFRGGAWYSNERYSKCTHRPGDVRKHRDPSIGFRCVKDLQER